MKTNQTTNEPSESVLATDEFADWVEKNGKTLGKHERYEVRPCNRVRGFMLRLPGVGWRFWFPNAAEAMNFAHRATSIYAADCWLYDSSGRQVC